MPGAVCFRFDAGAVCPDFAHTGGEGRYAVFETFHEPSDLDEWLAGTSRPGARRWCAMELCGNRHKLRALRARRTRTRDRAGPGVTTTIPASIRNLVRHRDRHCRWPGCRQPAAVCEVHHVRHKANGGRTSLANCVLLCRYHHQIAIHRQGWTLILRPDGTTTAWNKDKTKVLRSHGPPARAG